MIVAIPFLTHFLLGGQRSNFRTRPLFFALDHINYARWLPVNLHDKLLLEQMHSEVYTDFFRDYFEIKKKSIFCDYHRPSQQADIAAIKGKRGALA